MKMCEGGGKDWVNWERFAKCSVVCVSVLSCI